MVNRKTCQEIFFSADTNMYIDIYFLMSSRFCCFYNFSKCVLVPKSTRCPQFSLIIHLELPNNYLYVVSCRFHNSTLTGVMSQNRKPGHVPSHTLQTLVEIQVQCFQYLSSKRNQNHAIYQACINMGTWEHGNKVPRQIFPKQYLAGIFS